MTQRSSDPEGFKTPSRISLSSIMTLIAFIGAVIGVGVSLGKAEYAQTQAEKVPKIEQDIAVIQTKIDYIKIGQIEQSKDLDELKDDMKSGFEDIKTLIRSKQ
mgnify:CR=1 FL=1